MTDVLRPRPSSALGRRVGWLTGEPAVAPHVRRLVCDRGRRRKLWRCLFEPTVKGAWATSASRTVASCEMGQGPPVRPLTWKARDPQAVANRGDEMAVLEMEIQARVYDGLVLWCQRGSSEMMRGLVCEVAWLQIKAGGHVIVALPASRRLLRQVIAEHPWMGRLVCGGLLATAGGRPRKEKVEKKKKKVSRVHSQSGHNSIDLQPDPDKRIVSEHGYVNEHKFDFIVSEDSWRFDNLHSVDAEDRIVA